MNIVETETGLKFELGKIKLPTINEFERWLVYAKGGGLEATKEISFDPNMTSQEKGFRLFQKQTQCMQDIVAKILS